MDDIVCYLGYKNIKVRVVDGKPYCGGSDDNVLTPIIHPECSNCIYNLAVAVTIDALEEKFLPALEKALSDFDLTIKTALEKMPSV